MGLEDSLLFSEKPNSNEFSASWQYLLCSEYYASLSAAVELAGVAPCLVLSHGYAALIPDAFGFHSFSIQFALRLLL